MSYVIKQEVQTNNRTKVPLDAEGVLIHETATVGATDEAESKYFNTTTRKASVHFFVDWDSITQKLPVNERCMGAGRTANSKYIQIEMCHVPHNVSRDEQVRMFNETWKRTVWLSAYLLLNYVYKKDVLTTHHEVTDLWHETDHTDPDAYFKEYGKTFEMFKADVVKEMEEQTHTAFKPVELKVIASSLNCRTAPNTSSSIIKQFEFDDKITAVGEDGDWWKLDINGKPGYVAKKYTTKR